MVLLGLLTVGALQRAVAMIVDPCEPLGMTVEFLEGTPVGNYFWPGVFLLGVAAASLLTLAGLLPGWRRRWAVGIGRAGGCRRPAMFPGPPGPAYPTLPSSRSTL